MRQRYDIKLLRSDSSLAEVKGEWSKQWLAHCADNIFLHFDWVASYVDAFDLADSLYVLIAVRDSDVVAVLPLYRSDRGVLRIIGDSRADYCDFICPREEAQEVWAAMMSFLLDRNDWLGLRIKQTPHSGNLWTVVNQDQNARYRCSWETMAPCPGIDLTLVADSMQSMLNKKSMRRVFNVMSRRGELKFRVLNSWAEIEENLEHLFQLHIARWQAIGDQSIYETKEQRKFARSYAKKLHAAGYLHLSILECGDDIAAMHLGFLSGGRFIWYKPTYNVEFSDNSPGKVLLRFLLEDTMKSGANYFDFTRGAEPYKLSLSNNVEQNYGLIIWSGLRQQIWYYLNWVLVRKMRSLAARIREKLPTTPTK